MENAWADNKLSSSTLQFLAVAASLIEFTTALHFITHHPESGKLVRLKSEQPDQSSGPRTFEMVKVFLKTEDSLLQGYNNQVLHHNVNFLYQFSKIYCMHIKCLYELACAQHWS